MKRQISPEQTISNLIKENKKLTQNVLTMKKLLLHERLQTAKMIKLNKRLAESQRSNANTNVHLTRSLDQANRDLVARQSSFKDIL